LVRILCIGDVVGSIGCEFLRSKLPALRREKAIDAVIANGENSADGNGLTPVSVQHLLDSGVDMITAGNHTFRRKESYDTFDTCENLIRPANFPAGAPGVGYRILDLGRLQIAVFNLLGTVYLESMPCPFDTLEKLLSNPDLPKLKILDFHGEATGEKRAFGFFCDGKITAMFGTHTHVQTADGCVLPEGTGYITDVGMTGVIHSVLGVKPEIIIGKLRSKMPARFDLAKGPCKMDCILFTADEKTGKCLEAETLSIT
jgi:metallophosphoesterase (TIGR00282 family)